MSTEQLQLYTTIVLAIITIFLIPLSKYIFTIDKRLVKIETIVDLSKK